RRGLRSGPRPVPQDAHRVDPPGRGGRPARRAKRGGSGARRGVAAAAGPGRGGPAAPGECAERRPGPAFPGRHTLRGGGHMTTLTTDLLTRGTVGAGSVGVGRAFGTFGELVQGVLPPDGSNFLVTLPIARWTVAV